MERAELWDNEREGEIIDCFRSQHIEGAESRQYRQVL